MKKIIPALLLFIALCVTSGSALEHQIPPPIVTLQSGISVISPSFINISSSSSSLSISSQGVATVSATVTGTSGVTTKSAITAELQQYKNGTWVTIATFSVSSNSYRASLSETKSVDKGYTYRVQATVTTTYGTSKESHVVTSASKAY